MEDQQRHNVLDKQGGWHLFERDQGSRRVLFGNLISLVPSINDNTISGSLSGHPSKLVLDTSGRFKMISCLPANIGFEVALLANDDPVFTLFYVSEHHIRTEAKHMLNQLPINYGVSKFMAEAAGMWYERALGEAFLFPGKH